MNDSHEFTGEDVQKAIQNGLESLGVGPNDVLVEVIEEASRGVFGIGARPAKVSLRLLRPPEPPRPSPDVIEEYDDEGDDFDYESPVVQDLSGTDGEIAGQILKDILARMGIEGDVIVRQAEPSRPGEPPPWMLDITGPDMSLLVGRRGDTLSALQYITRLIASRRLQRRANIIVDAGGYKSRRSKRLRELATQMADQAVNQNRAVSLEPMPPNERRIIHLELRGRKDVETQSTGEGNNRKVTIIPKNRG